MFELLVQLLVDHHKKVAVVTLLEEIYSKRFSSKDFMGADEVMEIIDDVSDDVFELEEILNDMIGRR